MQAPQPPQAVKTPTTGTLLKFRADVWEMSVVHKALRKLADDENEEIGVRGIARAMIRRLADAALAAVREECDERDKNAKTPNEIERVNVP